jgi:hypothetical protein
VANIQICAKKKDANALPAKGFNRVKNSNWSMVSSKQDGSLWKGSYIVTHHFASNNL